MQLASPITPCAASSSCIFGLSRWVMTISTPSLIRIDHSVPKVCADVASSPCTFLRGSLSHHHVMLPELHHGHNGGLPVTDDVHLCICIMAKDRCMEAVHAAAMLCEHQGNRYAAILGWGSLHLKSSSTKRGAALNAAYVAARLSGASSAFDAPPVLPRPEQLLSSACSTACSSATSAWATRTTCKQADQIDVSQSQHSDRSICRSLVALQAMLSWSPCRGAPPSGRSMARTSARMQQESRLIAPAHAAQSRQKHWPVSLNPEERLQSPHRMFSPLRTNVTRMLL